MQIFKKKNTGTQRIRRSSQQRAVVTRTSDDLKGVRSRFELGASHSRHTVQ